MVRGSLYNLARHVKNTLKGWAYVVAPDPLLNWIIRSKMPKTGQLEATTACNLDCPLCGTHFVPRKTRNLTMAHVDNVVDACGKRMKSVCFHLMGEPLLNPEIFKLVKRCSDQGIETSFGTNGMLIDHFSNEIIDSGLSFLSVAIDGANEEDYEKYRIRGKFDKVVKNTKSFLAEKKRRGAKYPVVQVQTVMFSYNEDKEDQVDEFLAEFDCEGTAKKKPNYTFDLDAGREKGLEIKDKYYDASATFLEKVDTDPVKYQHARPEETSKELFRNMRMCPQLEKVTALSDGRIVACCIDSMGLSTFGNLNDDDFKRIWRSDAHKTIIDRFLKRELDVCEYCTLN